MPLQNFDKSKRTDPLCPEQRHKCMSRIKGKDTKPELLIRSGLHDLGFRFRLHQKSLPGKPDIVFKRYNAVIFINGCFWHGHDCHLFKWPKTRADFWRNKITRTKSLDQKNLDSLYRMNWRILSIWECAIKGKSRIDLGSLLEMITIWLDSDIRMLEIEGEPSLHKISTPTTSGSIDTQKEKQKPNR